MMNLNSNSNTSKIGITVLNQSSLIAIKNVVIGIGLNLLTRVIATSSASFTVMVMPTSTTPSAFTELRLASV